MTDRQRPSRRGEKAGNSAPGLRFINITTPSDSRSSDVRKQVRSHVTSRQHHHEWQRWLQHSRAKVQRHVSQVYGDTNVQEQEQELEAKRALIEEENEENLRPAHIKSCSDVIGPADMPGTVAMQLIALDGIGTTVEEAIFHLRTDPASILKYYDFIVRTQAGDIQQQFSTDTHRTVAHKRFMTFMLADPISLTTALLMGLRSSLAPSGQPLSGDAELHVLRLKDFLIRNINAALEYDDRRLSNHMLVCISLLAAYEAKYERPDMSNYDLHMRGLIQMIQLRGGLQAIGLRVPWIERLLVWTDLNSSSMLGRTPYCSRIAPPSFRKRPRANLTAFTARDAHATAKMS